MSSSQRTYRAEVAFICTSLKGGGSERVSITAAERLATWGIRSHFLSNRYAPSEFVLPTDIGASISLLPDEEDLYSAANMAFAQEYLRHHQVSIVFLVYVDVAPFVEMQSALPCRWVYWLHSAPFWELTHAQQEGMIRSRYSIKWWIRWHLLGGKRRANSQAYRQTIYQRYLFDLEHVDRYIVLCPEYIEEVRERLALTSPQASKILSLTNTNTSAPSDKTILEGKERVIIFAGRFSLVEKRIDLLLEIWRRAAKRLPDWSLKLYGAGTDRLLIERLIAQHHIPRVEICGFETSQRKIYASASISCLTSPIEGWPLSLTEAQTWGCVPFAFDCSAGVRAIIGNHGEAGCLIPFGDIERYTQELIALCSEHDRLHEMQLRCLERSRLYTHEVNDNTWDALLRQLLPSSSSSTRN